MKNHNFKITVIAKERTEVYDVDGLVNIIHFMIDVVILHLQKENIIIQIERKENENEQEKDEAE